jgi:hypothetical protein
MNVFTFIAAQPFYFSASSSESQAVKNRIINRFLYRESNRKNALNPYKIRLYGKKVER